MTNPDKAAGKDHVDGPALDTIGDSEWDGVEYDGRGKAGETSLVEVEYN